MRVVLIGTPAERAALRRALAGASVTISGEADSIAAARADGHSADAWVVAPPTDDGPIVDEALTARERQVLELLAEGLPNKAIAKRLEISDQTVKFHVASIGSKLGAANRTDAVRRAVRRGLIAL